MKRLVVIALILAGCEVPKFGSKIKFVDGFYEGCSGVVAREDYDGCAVVDRLECPHVSYTISGTLRVCGGNNDWEYDK